MYVAPQRANSLSRKDRQEIGEDFNAIPVLLLRELEEQ